METVHTRYKLRALIEHTGETISSGHYVAVTKPDNSEGELWCCYSDTFHEPMCWKQVKQHQAYLLLYEKENSQPHDPRDQKMDIEEVNEAEQSKAISPSNDEAMLQELDTLSRKEQSKGLRNHLIGELDTLTSQQWSRVSGDESVFLKCLVKKEAERITYERISVAAKSQLKLRGGATTKEEGVKQKSSKKRDRKTGDEEQQPCLLRKPPGDTDEAPLPKRRNTNKLSSETEKKEELEANNEKSSQAQDAKYPSEDREDIEMIGHEKNEPEGSAHEMLTSTDGDKTEKSISERWDTDAELKKEKMLKAKLIDRANTTQRITEAVQLLLKENKVKESDPVIKNPAQVPVHQPERERESDRTNTAHSQPDVSIWRNSNVPKPSSLPWTYIDQDTPSQSQAGNLESRNGETQIENLMSENKPQAEDVPEETDVDMTASRSTRTRPHAELNVTYKNLEEWKKSVIQHLTYLKAELGEDMQLWRQEVARTTVKELVNSLESSLIGVFADVEKLKTTTKELLQVSQRKAEVMQGICAKILTPKESEELKRELQDILSNCWVPSPTPSSFRGNTPIAARPIQDHLMDIDDSLTTHKGRNHTTRLNHCTSTHAAEPTNAADAPNRPRIWELHETAQEQHTHGHFNYLRKCWEEQIALPLAGPQKRNMYSFKNALVATGYDKIVITWQGMFYEVSEDNIELGNMTRKISPDDEVCKWVTEGVTVFKWKPHHRHILRRHRFAIRSLKPGWMDRKVFKPTKYYIHVYQTKIERAWNDLRTLHSRTMAQHLSQNWGRQYWPRSIDIKLIQNERTRDKSFRSLSNQVNSKPLWNPPDTSTIRSSISSLTTKSSRLRRNFRRSSGNTTSKSRRHVQRRVIQQSRNRPLKQVLRERRLSMTNKSNQRRINKSNASRKSSNLQDFAEMLEQISRDVNLLKSKIDL